MSESVQILIKPTEIYKEILKWESPFAKALDGKTLMGSLCEILKLENLENIKALFLYNFIHSL